MPDSVATLPTLVSQIKILKRKNVRTLLLILLFINVSCHSELHCSVRRTVFSQQEVAVSGFVEFIKIHEFIGLVF